MRGIEKPFHKATREYGEVQGFLCIYSSSNGAKEITIFFDIDTQMT